VSGPAGASRLIPSLLRRSHDLASPAQQRARLARLPIAKSFDRHLTDAALRLQREAVAVLQMNLGKRCNQTCRHCHVDAGPDRREVMGDAVFEACLAFVERHGVQHVDITGGAPELHPRFRELVERARAVGCQVMDRCNLTITQLPNYAYLPEFFAKHRVSVVASLPWFRATETDAQRGAGVFEDSLAALRELNRLGYGRDGSGLELTLVTNPNGAFLPARQDALERQWKRELKRLHGIEFNRLFSITNMPISRYLEFLERTGQLETYMQRLVQAFNPAAVAGLMCRNTLSVGFDGRLFDCDFNQMLELSLPFDIFDVEVARLSAEPITTATHCFGCTAGGGSSCGGATA